METPTTSAISLLDEVKLQATVLVPVLRALRAELGRERADRVVGTALADWSRDLYRRIGEDKGGTARERWDAIWADLRPRIAGSVDQEMLRNDATAREFNVTSCSYAEFFKALGEPELGALLVCDLDFRIAEIGGASVELTRSQTIMKGAPYCDFRYRFRP